MSSRPGRAPPGRPARRSRSTCGSGSRASWHCSRSSPRPRGRRPHSPPLPGRRRRATAVSLQLPGT
eukprot:6635522-Alexandrium_andersonii.AAC.1